MQANEDFFKPLLNLGESAVLSIAQEVCTATETKAFAKIRIADVVTIARSGLTDDLYRYALSAHFDVLVSKENRAFLAIEFDGEGHSARNDAKKRAICDHFGIPMVRVRKTHLQSKLFEDTAVAFFIWQLFCVDAFLNKYGTDPYEPYDPEWFVSVPGKTRVWPFAYAQRWRAKLERPFRDAAHRFDAMVRDFYSHGLLQFGTVTVTYYRELEYRSIYAQMVGSGLLVIGQAELAVEVCGLNDPRRELFGEIATFVEGLAAERMYRHAINFLNGKAQASPVEFFNKQTAAWEKDGFRLRRGQNLSKLLTQ